MGNLFRNVKGSKFWKRMLAGALSLLMILTLVPAAVSDVVAADDFEVVTFDGYIKRGDTVIPISNVTEVYEGDILTVGDEESIAEVSWSDEIGQFILVSLDGTLYPGSSSLISQSKVIGNIYQNSDILMK